MRSERSPAAVSVINSAIHRVQYRCTITLHPTCSRNTLCSDDNTYTVSHANGPLQWKTLAAVRRTRTVRVICTRLSACSNGLLYCCLTTHWTIALCVLRECFARDVNARCGSAPRSPHAAKHVTACCSIVQSFICHLSRDQLKTLSFDNNDDFDPLPTLPQKTHPLYYVQKLSVSSKEGLKLNSSLPQHREW